MDINVKNQRDTITKALSAITDDSVAETLLAIQVSEETLEKAVAAGELQVYSTESLLKYQSDLKKALHLGRISSDDLQKAKKDLSKLVKVTKTDKNGKKQTVWVKRGEEPHKEHQPAQQEQPKTNAEGAAKPEMSGDHKALLEKKQGLHERVKQALQNEKDPDNHAALLQHATRLEGEVKHLSGGGGQEQQKEEPKAEAKPQQPKAEEKKDTSKPIKSSLFEENRKKAEAFDGGESHRATDNAKVGQVIMTGRSYDIHTSTNKGQTRGVVDAKVTAYDKDSVTFQTKEGSRKVSTGVFRQMMKEADHHKSKNQSQVAKQPDTQKEAPSAPAASKSTYESHTTSKEEGEAVISRQKNLIANPKSPEGVKKRALRIIEVESKKHGIGEKKSPEEGSDKKSEPSPEKATDEKSKAKAALKEYKSAMDSKLWNKLTTEKKGDEVDEDFLNKKQAFISDLEDALGGKGSLGHYGFSDFSPEFMDASEIKKVTEVVNKHKEGLLAKPAKPAKIDYNLKSKQAHELSKNAKTIDDHRAAAAVHNEAASAFFRTPKGIKHNQKELEHRIKFEDDAFLEDKKKYYEENKNEHWADKTRFESVISKIEAEQASRKSKTNSEPNKDTSAPAEKKDTSKAAKKTGEQLTDDAHAASDGTVDKSGMTKSGSEHWKSHEKAQKAHEAAAKQHREEGNIGEAEYHEKQAGKHEYRVRKDDPDYWSKQK